MNKITAAATLLLVIIVAAATTWFFLNQTNTLNQINDSNQTNNPNQTDSPNQTDNPNQIDNPNPTDGPNPTSDPNQTYDVRITAFSVDPEGWKAPYDNEVVKCSVNVTLQNIGTNDVQGLKLIVVMYRLGDVVGGLKQGVLLGLGSSEPLNFMLRAGEVRSFQGEMTGSVDAIGTSDGHPVGATYVAQVKLGWGDTLDEAEWKPP